MTAVCVSSSIPRPSRGGVGLRPLGALEMKAQSGRVENAENPVSLAVSVSCPVRGSVSPRAWGSEEFFTLSYFVYG